jgi:hypothetical protein
MLTVLGSWARSSKNFCFQAMSEEQLKAAETEATAQVEDAIEEISEEDLAGVAGGVIGNLTGVEAGNSYSLPA